jgi:hypothetical protein
MYRPPHPPWFNHPDNIQWRIQVMKFIIMHFSPRSVFLPFRVKFPQHSVIRNSQSVFLPQSEEPSFAPIQYSWQNNSYVCLIFRFFDMRLALIGWRVSESSLFWAWYLLLLLLILLLLINYCLLVLILLQCQVRNEFIRISDKLSSWLEVQVSSFWYNLYSPTGGVMLI